jgi:hypothetical protein
MVSNPRPLAQESSILFPDNLIPSKEHLSYQILFGVEGFPLQYLTREHKYLIKHSRKAAPLKWSLSSQLQIKPQPAIKCT